jgi:hypothetical protein
LICIEHFSEEKKSSRRHAKNLTSCTNILSILTFFADFYRLVLLEDGREAVALVRLAFKVELGHFSPQNDSFYQTKPESTFRYLRQVFVATFFNKIEQPTVTAICGIPVTAVFASQLEAIWLQHSNEHQQPQFFLVQPLKHTFKVRQQDMKATQIPLLVNNATTGHKLQGSGIEKLFVYNWSYVTNSVYIMLSRVKTMSGLFARFLLSLDLKKYEVKDSYQSMLLKLRKKTFPYF